MARVLILGGGFGGVSAACTLREKLSSKDEVILVDRRTHFMVGFRKTWALVGDTTLEEGQRPIAVLKERGVQVIHAPVSRFDPAARTAEVDGQQIQADAVVVALGAELAPETVPGFQSHAFNIYDPQDIPRAAEALRRFRGGRVVVGIFGVPYKCPPAPYEIALLVRESFRARGVNVQMEAFSPQPMSLPILGQTGCDIVESRLAEEGITFLPNHKAAAVEAGEVVFANERRPFDMLLGVPPHRCPAVVTESGLTGGDDWVSVEARTLETKFPNVYAVGDVAAIAMANGKPLPKAGVFAEAQGKVAAERIAATLAGAKPQAVFSGEGGCFLEVGRGEAMMVQGSFLTEPAPQVSLSDASASYLEQKRSFEAERLRAWFS